MKKILFGLSLYAFPCLAISSPVSTHPSQTPTTSTTPVQTQAPAKQAYRPKLIIPPSDKQKQANLVSGEFFYYPGVVSAKDGRWVGSDNFLNISKNVALQVNFIKTDDAEISFTAAKFQEEVNLILSKGGLTISTSGSDNKPPLPFFNLIVMITATSDGLAACCQGRLFEQVNLARVQFKEEVFQAITWEQSNLVFGPKDEFEKLLKKTIEGLVNTFITRLNAHQTPNNQS